MQAHCKSVCAFVLGIFILSGIAHWCLAGYLDFWHGLALKISSVGDFREVGLQICCLSGFTRIKTWVKWHGEVRSCMGVERASSKNTASKLGFHTKTDRGTCPGVRPIVYYMGVIRIGSQPCWCHLWPSFARAHSSRGCLG
jgi:hypothetical protein